MAGPARIKDPRQLEDFRAALGRFRHQTLGALMAADRQIVAAKRKLDDRLRHWQGEIRQAARALQEAERDYEDCRESRDDEGRAPDCTQERRAVEAARTRLSHAQDALRTVQKYQRQLADTEERYRRQVATVRQVVETHSQKAERALAQALDDLRAYERINIMVSLFGAGLVSSFASRAYKRARGQVGSSAVNAARKQEIALVRAAGRGTRDWTKSELRQLDRGLFPKLPGSKDRYPGHHINNVARFPELAANPDNIRFVTPREHYDLHYQGKYRKNTSGKMFNRKSLMKQWAKPPLPIL